MRSACPPIMYACKYLNFSRGNSDMDLLARRVIQELEGDEGQKHVDEYADRKTERGKCLLKSICEKFGFDSLGYQSLDGVLAVKALTEDGYDFAYVHVEAPDEMGHQGSKERKIQAIQFLDEKVIKVIADALEEKNVDFRMLVMPDHPTPVAVRTHTSNPVPYMLYDSTDKKSESWSYNEKDAKASGNYIAEGHMVINHLFEK